MWRPTTYQLTYFSKSNHLWIYGSWGRAWSLQWDLISQWFLFQPSHNSSSRHNQEIYCKCSAPKVTSNTPQCWLVFFCSILDTSVYFFLNFLPPNKMCPIKVSVPNPSFPRRPPSSTVPKLKAPPSASLVPKTQKSHHPCYSTGHTAVGSSERFHVVPYSAVETSSPSVSSSHHSAKGKMELEIPAFTVFSSWSLWLPSGKKCSQDYGECNVDFPLKSIRCPKGFRVAQKQLWGGFPLNPFSVNTKLIEILRIIPASPKSSHSQTKVSEELPLGSGSNFIRAGGGSRSGSNFRSSKNTKLWLCWKWS